MNPTHRAWIQLSTGILIACACFWVWDAKANSGGPSFGYTGAPNDFGTCTSCHSQNTPVGSVSINGLPTFYNPSQTYGLSVTVNDAGSKFGFQLTAINSAGQQAGNLQNPNANTQVITGSPSGLTRKYIEHTTSGTSFSNWSFNWTAPASSAGPVNFYVAGLRADGVNGSGGDTTYTSSGTVAPPSPTITTQPTSQSAFTGSNASFVVVASGAAPLRYQWRFGANNLANATNSTYAVTNAQPANAGSYIVVVTNSFGSVTSFVATLSVVTLPPDNVLDTTFGTGGKVTTGFGFASAEGYSVAVQGDGKIIVAGEASYNFAVARYNANGSLDTNFNGTGTVITPISNVAAGRSVAVQSDGKIVVAGYAYIGGGRDFAVVRYNTNGTLDTNFNGTGIVTTPIIGSSYDEANSVVVQSDGKIVVAGYADNGSPHFAVVRYNASGSLDNTFNGTGKVTTSISFDDVGRSVALQSDGKIVVAGDVADYGRDLDFALVRYNTNGFLDTSFSGGKVRTAFGAFDSGSDDVGYSVAMQSDGKIVVAGRYSDGGNYHLALSRYNTNGSLDTNFNGSGIVTTPVNSFSDEANGVAVQSDGKIVVAGYAYSGDSQVFALLRYNVNGILDTNFNGSGKVTTRFGSYGDVGRSVAILSDGKIVVAGYTSDSNNVHSFALARYAPPNSPSVTMQPTDQTVSPGSNVTLAVAAIGTPLPNYQWRTNGINVTGTTNSTITVTNFQAANQAGYDVVVTNSVGAVTSSPAILYLNSPVRFTNLTRQANFNFAALLIGAANTNYLIESSSSLTNWTTVRTSSSPNGLINFIDTNAIDGGRVYRARFQ